ncbi:MAG: ADP-ribosylglycohydrolase family protein [Gammaproteobacteria bacterium]
MGLKQGMVTDDTTMSLALGNTIINTQRINPYDIAHAFSDWLKAKPIDVGNTVRRGIQNFRITNDPFVSENGHSAGNGACMRCLPIAISTLNKPRTDVILANKYQGHITHNNKLSDVGTQCVIDMVQMAINGNDLESVLSGPVSDLTRIHKEFQFHEHPASNPSGYIVDTLKTVFESLASTESFEDCLVRVVNRGGDADTTGAIAGMIAGSLYGFESIPEHWIDQLDANVHSECEYQAKMLYQLRDNIHISDSNPLI